MDNFLVEVTIVQEVKAKSKEDAEKVALKKIPMYIFERFKTNLEVNWR